jgi:DNA modification methylase
MLLRGDCLELLRGLPDCSVDSVVTDPPYELGFMGKRWDASGVAYSVELWGECLRVLKPGGHVLAFGGTRTYHRMVVAIEDAGFEIRDSIHWIYGSGFPKSLDVSKAIDKMHGPEKMQTIIAVTSWIRDARDVAEITNADIDRTFQLRTMARHWTDVPPEGKQPSVPTAEQWPVLLELLGVDNPPQHVRDAVDDWLRMKGQPAPTWHERVVVGTRDATVLAVAPGEGRDRPDVEVAVTAPATAEAQQWLGWGTALKPAHEPVVVARKPLDGTVAGNVLGWGVGGLNIDACRVAMSETDREAARVPNAHLKSGIVDAGRGGHERNGEKFEPSSLGRWPANVVHDGSPEVCDRFGEASRFFPGLGWGDVDVGSFLYCAKAGKRERNAGLDGMPEATAGEMTSRKDGSAGLNSPRAGAGRTSGAANVHPTVKPIALMRWLVRLVTPPDGTVLDPFLGSGTTAVAATLEGVKWVGCEMTEDYWPIIEGRVRWAEGQRGLL